MLQSNARQKVLSGRFLAIDEPRHPDGTALTAAWAGGRAGGAGRSPLVVPWGPWLLSWCLPMGCWGAQCREGLGAAALRALCTPSQFLAVVFFFFNRMSLFFPPPSEWPG